MIRRLLGQSLFYGLTTLVSRGTIVVLLLLLPLFLKPTDYGVLAMITTISGLVNILVPLEITQALIRFFPKADLEQRRLYASTAWSFTVYSVLLCLAASEGVAGVLCAWILNDARYTGAFRIGLGVMAFNVLFYFIQNQFRWEFRTRGYAGVSLLFCLSTLGLSIALAIFCSVPLVGVLIGQACGGALAVAWGTWRLRASIGAGIDTSKLQEMLGISLPLVPASLAFLFSQYAGRFILNRVAGLEAVGIFSFASQIAGIAAVALVGVQAAVTPLIAAHFEEPGTPALLGRTFQLFTGLGLIVSLGLGLVSPELIEALVKPGYRAAAPLVLILSLAVIVSGMYFFLPGFFVAKKTMRQMWVSLATVTVSVVLNYFLAVAFGVYGAAVATLLAAIFFIGIWYLFSQRLYPIPICWGAVTLSGFTAFAAGNAALFINYPSPAVALATKAITIVGVSAVIVASGLIPLRDLMTGARAALAKAKTIRAGARANFPPRA